MLKGIIQKLDFVLGIDALRWEALPHGIYSVNLHRIGDWRKTCFDPCVFSCDSRQLQEYVQFFKQSFDILTIAEAIELIENDCDKIYGRYMIITFDDGYKDNYTVALPVLEQENVTACFFIATSLIGNQKLPWWDKIAYIFKEHRFKSIKLSHWTDSVHFAGDDREFIRAILNAVKNSQVSMDEQLHEIEQLYPIDSEVPVQSFLSWNDLSEMIDKGMDVGAHSHNHEILSNLTSDQIIYELTHSKEIIECNLPYEVNSFSYPVGSLDSYNGFVVQALIDCGYSLAFNFQPGINRSIRNNRFDLRRFSIGPSTTISSLKNTICHAQVF